MQNCTKPRPSRNTRIEEFDLERLRSIVEHDNRLFVFTTREETGPARQIGKEDFILTLLELQETPGRCEVYLHTQGWDGATPFDADNMNLQVVTRQVRQDR